MGKNEIKTAESPPAGLNELRFETPPRRISRALVWRLLGLALVLAAGGVLLALMIGPLLFDPGSTPGLLLGVLVISGVAIFVLAFSKVTIEERSVSIKDGVLRLESPIRRTQKLRTRDIRLSDIVEVEPSLGSDGRQGVDVLLKDGTKFFLAQSSFGLRGLEIMDKLSMSFGHRYLDEVKEILLKGQRFGFRVVKPVAVKEEAITISRQMQTSTGHSRTVPLDDILTLEKVSTHYAGDAVLVTLTTGTQFLFRQAEVEAIGLMNFPRIADKFRTS